MNIQIMHGNRLHFLALEYGIKTRSYQIQSSRVAFNNRTSVT